MDLQHWLHNDDEYIEPGKINIFIKQRIFDYVLCFFFIMETKKKKFCFYMKHKNQSHVVTWKQTFFSFPNLFCDWNFSYFFLKWKIQPTKITYFRNMNFASKKNGLLCSTFFFIACDENIIFEFHIHCLLPIIIGSNSFSSVWNNQGFNIINQNQNSKHWKKNSEFTLAYPKVQYYFLWCVTSISHHHNTRA